MFPQNYENTRKITMISTGQKGLIIFADTEILQRAIV
jgi:hypothetical protein